MALTEVNTKEMTKFLGNKKHFANTSLFIYICNNASAPQDRYIYDTLLTIMWTKLSLIKLLLSLKIRLFKCNTLLSNLGEQSEKELY